MPSLPGIIRNTDTRIVSVAIRIGDVDLATLQALRQWAAWLGWPDLVVHHQEVPSGEQSRHSVETMCWYTCGSYDDVILQINENPSWQAAVYAIRYRICTGWHSFEFTAQKTRLRDEAKRLESLLHRRWFVTLDGRRAFRTRYPEYTGYTWRRLRESGPP